MTNRQKDKLITACFFAASIILFLIMIGFVLIQPFMESQTFNKLTGADTTVWDAIWVELRVTESPNNTK